MKEEYQIRDADFVCFQTEDIITTSVGDTDTGLEEEGSLIE